MSTMKKATHSDPDEMVLLQTYRFNSEAERIQRLLEREGIPSMIQGYYTNQLFALIADLGGSRILVPRYEWERAFELLRKEGEELPDPMESNVGDLNRLLDKQPLFKGMPRERKLLLWIVLIAAVLAIFILVLLSWHTLLN